MRHCWVLCVGIMLLTKTKSQGDSSEDQPPYGYSYSNPSTVDFQDTTATRDSKAIDEDEYFSTTTIEKNYILRNTPPQYVEFRLEEPSPPPPRFILNSTFLEKTPKTTTTEEPYDVIKVRPINRNHQRGVLDLLFPVTRVKSFKNVFDSIRRLLSHTFRR